MVFRVVTWIITVIIGAVRKRPHKMQNNSWIMCLAIKTHTVGASHERHGRASGKHRARVGASGRDRGSKEEQGAEEVQKTAPENDPPVHPGGPA